MLTSTQKEWFDKIYAQYAERMIAYALVITKDRELAKDAVSDVFLNWMKSGGDTRSIADVKSYLLVSVRNRAIRLVSNSKKLHHDLDTVVLLSNAIDPSDLLVGKELQRVIDKAKSKLSKKALEVFRLVKEKNYSYQQVGEELGLSLDAVKYHMKNSLRVLREELQKYDTSHSMLKWIALSLVMSAWAALLGA